MSENTDLLRRSATGSLRFRTRPGRRQAAAGICPIVSQLKDANSTLSSLVDTFSPVRRASATPAPPVVPDQRRHSEGC